MAVEAPPAPAAAAPAAPAAPAPPPPNMIDPLPVPTNPPRPGSARERMQKETGKKWGEEPPAAPTTKPAEPTKPAQPAAARPGEEPPAPAEPPADITPEQKKQNPWKLYREEKERAAKLEKQISEAKSASLAEKEKAEYQERIEKAEKRLKEQEDELRFKSYEKSEEFRTKYEQPYERAWEKHMKDLRGVTVAGDDGVARPMEAKDILDLVNLELPDARKLAVEKWGDFAQDAMLARKEIRDLFEAKTNALDEARKTGADREKQFEENRKKWVEGVQKHIKETWEAANQAALNDPKNGEFFKPVEGDDKWNELLTKGFQRVDQAFGKNPMDPKLTPEERAKAVREHAAVRNRSAAFGPMKYIIARLRAEIEALKKANQEFKGSQPPSGGGTAAPSGGAPTGNARDRMHAAGDKYAK